MIATPKELAPCLCFSRLIPLSASFVFWPLGEAIQTSVSNLFWRIISLVRGNDSHSTSLGNDSTLPTFLIILSCAWGKDTHICIHIWYRLNWSWRLILPNSHVLCLSTRYYLSSSRPRAGVCSVLWRSIQLAYYLGIVIFFGIQVTWVRSYDSEQSIMLNI